MVVNQTHETRAKISALAEGRKASPETRMRMSERQLGKETRSMERLILRKL
jgi:hypothetical protein